MSLAGIADYVFVEAIIDKNRSSICLIPTSSDGFFIERYLFNDGMKSSFTAQIKFKNCKIDSHNFFISSNSNDSQFMRFYQRIWFHLLISCCNIIGLRSVFHEVQSVINSESNKSSIEKRANLDVGKLNLELSIAEKMTKTVLSELDSLSWRDDKISDALKSSAILKYTTSQCYDSLNQLVYSYLGAKAFLNEKINRKLIELRYIKVQPMSNVDIIDHFLQQT